MTSNTPTDHTIDLETIQKRHAAEHLEIPNYRTFRAVFWTFPNISGILLLIIIVFIIYHRIQNKIQRRLHEINYEGV